MFESLENGNLPVVIWSKFAFINLGCALIAAALWYLFPQLMAWPLLIGVLPWLLRLAHEGRWRWRTPFDLPLLLFVISGLISVWTAYDRDMAWAKFWMIAAGVILFYAFAAFSLPGAPNDQTLGAIPVAWLLAFFGAGAALYFMTTHDWDAFPVKVEFLSKVGRTLQEPLPDLPGHRLHPNVIGGILAMMIPFSTAVSVRAGKARNWPAALLGLLLLILTMSGLLLSASRGAWLALAAALGLALLWGLAGLGSNQQPGRRRNVFFGVFLGVVILGSAAMLLWPTLVQFIMDRLPLLAGGQERLQLFQNSLNLVRDYPFVGAGLGSFMMLYSTYSYLTHVGFIIHAHNIYLDVIIEQGLIGLVPLIWMWIVFAVALWRDSYEGRLRPYLGAAALSLVTILLHGLVEDALYGSRSLMLLFLPLAFALPFPKRTVQIVQKPAWIVQGVALGLLIVGLLLWARPLASAAVSNFASIRQSRLELSRYSRPEWPIQDAVRRDINLSRAISGYELALDLYPQNASANRRLGQIELSLGKYDNALLHLETAYRRAPWDYASRLMFGEALLVNGELDAGAALWQDIENQHFQLDARAFWYSHIEDENRLENIELGIERNTQSKTE